MANIDISRLSNIYDELEDLNGSDVLFVDEGSQSRYVIMPIEIFDQLEELIAMLKEPESMPVVKFSGEDIELSYDEYERIKNQIMEAVEKTLMPKPEKLN
ncbi:MAG: hypothetical protein IKS51_05680 [Erysipelotrichaceae bacterium]|nr:hypothetical protein [Erysipelotrichaceae bacterium]